MLTLTNTIMLHMYLLLWILLVLTALQINSLVPRPPPSFLLPGDNLSCEGRLGREKGKGNLIERGLTNHKYAVGSRLIEHSTVSSTYSDGSHALAVSSNSKHQERSTLTYKRDCFACQLSQFSARPLMSQLAAGTIPKSLRIDLWTTIYYGVTW